MSEQLNTYRFTYPVRGGEYPIETSFEFGALNSVEALASAEQLAKAYDAEYYHLDRIETVSIVHRGTVDGK
jgi:hypothetical protein